HRVTRSPGSASVRAHRAVDRTSQDAREGPPFGTRPSHDGRTPATPPRLSQVEDAVALPGTDRQTRTPQVVRTQSGPSPGAATGRARPALLQTGRRPVHFPKILPG